MQNRIILRADDLIILHGIKKSAAEKKITHLKIVLNKESHQKITISEYASYYGLNLFEVLTALKLV